MTFLSKIKDAFRKNLLPGFVLWVFGMSLIGAYFYLPGVHAALDAVAGLKDRYSFLFSALSMGLLAGWIPAMVALGMGRMPPLPDSLFPQIPKSADLDSATMKIVKADPAKCRFAKPGTKS